MGRRRPSPRDDAVGGVEGKALHLGGVWGTFVEERSRRVLEVVAVVLAVGFVMGVTFIPHLDTQSRSDVEEGNPWVVLAGTTYDWVRGDWEGYRFPVHVDEHVHWVHASAIQREDTRAYAHPYTGAEQVREEFELRGDVHYGIFHTGLAQAQELTGVSWVSVFQFLPAFWAGLIAVLVWGALRPWPGAPLAAALTGLMPTTVRFLGPGFLVPIAFGLAWVGALLVLLPRMGESVRVALLALLLVFSAFFVHIIAGVVALGLLLAALPFAAARWEGAGARARLAGITVGAVLPMVWLYEAFFDEILAEVQRVGSLPLDVTVWAHMGVFFLVAWVVGLGLVAYRSPDRGRLPLRAASLLSVVLFGLLLANFVWLGPRLATYDRFHQPFLLVAAVPVAFVLFEASRAVARGVVWGVGWARERWGGEAVRGLDGALRGFVVVGVVGVLFVGLASPALSAALNEPYYRVIDEEDWERFVWVEENVGEEYEVFLAHPWKAPILTAMTGMQPYAWLSPGSPPVNGEAFVAYLQGTGNDTAWLVEREVSVVVGERMPVSDVFVEEREGVAVLEEEIAKRLHDARR